jgi:hypothetical protein
VRDHVLRVWHRHARAWRIALLISLVGVLLLMLPLGDHPRWQSLLNAAHVPLFGAPSALWVWALRGEDWPRWRALSSVALLGGALAVGSELLQYWIPGRWPDRADLARNLLGLGLGLLLGALLPRWRRAT